MEGISAPPQAVIPKQHRLGLHLAPCHCHPHKWALTASAAPEAIGVQGTRLSVVQDDGEMLSKGFANRMKDE